MPFNPAPPREGRTGLSREEKARYHRRLLAVIKTHGPKWLPARITYGDHVPGTAPPKEWVTIPARRETLAILKHLQAGHTATRVGSKLSTSEVLDAALAAGIPVLLREGGWSLDVAPGDKAEGAANE
jgi:hypothetical protein